MSGPTLRPPPRPAPRSARTSWLGWVQIALLVAILVAVALDRPAADGPDSVSREVAAKLEAAGALDEAAEVYAIWLAAGAAEPATRANVAYHLGVTFLEQGDYGAALRWLYEAETIGGGPADTGAKIVHALERMGRTHQARAALSSRAALDPVARASSDAVAARIDEREIRASEVLRALDDLPPQYAAAFDGAEGRGTFLEKYVADELILRKAAALELDGDAEVNRRAEAARRQIVLDTFLEREVIGKVEVADADLQTFFAANSDRYQPEEGDPVTLDAVRERVERDYLGYRVGDAYRQLVETELSAAGVELFPEALQ